MNEHVQYRPSREELGQVLDLLAEEARKYLGTVDERPAGAVNSEFVESALMSPLPDDGIGAVQSLRLLIDKGIDASVASSGPRCFHFVIGGTTPAALGADWLASALDQIAYT